MTHGEARRWAEEWIAAWNRHDVDTVVGHFADDVEFCSPIVATVTEMAVFGPDGTVTRGWASTTPAETRRCA